jgi:hypothetical protein
MKTTLLVLSLLSHVVQASVMPQPIPRVSTRNFLNDGIFEGGGTGGVVNLAGIRFAPHSKEGYERWVIDFSDEPRQVVGASAPPFQVRYVKAEKVPVPQGSDILVSPPKFVLTFRSINRNLIKKDRIERFLKKSKYVKDVILYPPIEGGDTAIELVLKDSVLFEAHQPTERQGRLVLDLKNAPLGQ